MGGKPSRKNKVALRGIKKIENTDESYDTHVENKINRCRDPGGEKLRCGKWMFLQISWIIFNFHQRGAGIGVVG